MKLRVGIDAYFSMNDPGYPLFERRFTTINTESVYHVTKFLKNVLRIWRDTCKMHEHFFILYIYNRFILGEVKNNYAVSTHRHCQVVCSTQ